MAQWVAGAQIGVNAIENADKIHGGFKVITQEEGQIVIKLRNKSSEEVMIEHIGDLNYYKKNSSLPSGGLFTWPFKAYNGWFNTSCLWCNVRARDGRRIGFNIYGESVPRANNEFWIEKHRVFCNGELIKTW